MTCIVAEGEHQNAASLEEPAGWTAHIPSGDPARRRTATHKELDVSADILPVASTLMSGSFARFDR